MNPAAAIAGLSFKPEHFDAALSCTAVGLWFEIHAENYMAPGGPRLAMLDEIRREHSLSVHGVGLSLASDAEPDLLHLGRLAAVVERYEPFLVSEHLAWSAWQGAYFPDLLPAPRTRQTLQRIARNIDIAQQHLKRRILIENPSHYLALEHEIPEPEFLAELVKLTGCGLLVDVNNAYVSAHNLGGDAAAYLAQLPAEAIGEIHLAGHARDAQHSQFLIDTHGAAIAGEVWNLYAGLLERIGARPSLIERDDNIPAFDELLSEQQRAAALLNGSTRTQPSMEFRHVRTG